MSERIRKQRKEERKEEKERKKIMQKDNNKANTLDPYERIKRMKEKGKER